nr:hypothetical protein [Streptomyces sp. DSM 41633]
MSGSEFGRPTVAPMPVKPPRPRREPKPKRPMHANITDGLLVLLAAASLGLSGWSLATLLMEAGAPVWVACLGVGVFDLVALAAGLQVYARRSAPHTAGGARLVMMAALIASSVVNGAHGVALGGWTTAVVLAAAPLSFEVVFELRHRTLTALIWVLWRRQAWTALRRDAWERIAPVAAGPTVTIEREHQDVDVVRPERPAAVAEPELVRAERPAIAAEPVTAEADVDERLREALALWQAVQSTPELPQADRVWAAGRVAEAAAGAGVPVAPLSPLPHTAPRPEPVARPADVPVQASGSPEDTDRHAEKEPGRVPAQAPASLAAGVRELRAARIADPAVMAARLSALMDRPIEVKSVKRELRRIAAAERAAAEADDAGTGAYL